MSVYKSRRKDAAADFLALARELRIETMRIIKKFPTSYRWMITNNLLTLAGEVYTYALKANAVYVHKDMSQHDYDLRHRFITMAISSADALLAEISFCYSLVDDGNNFFKDKAEYEGTFQRWTETGNLVLKKLRGVKDSDTKRWNRFLEKRQQK